MFLSQTETYSSMNYRLMSQARYGAESGIQKAANYLLYTYAAPVDRRADPIANYNTTVSPVTCTNGCPNIGQPVVLSANAAVPSNYPDRGGSGGISGRRRGNAAGGQHDSGVRAVRDAPVDAAD